MADHLLERDDVLRRQQDLRRARVDQRATLGVTAQGFRALASDGEVRERDAPVVLAHHIRKHLLPLREDGAKVELTVRLLSLAEAESELLDAHRFEDRGLVPVRLAPAETE